MSPRAMRMTPTLRYRDPAAAIAWLEAAFGMTPHFVARHEGAVVHAQMRLGESWLFLGPDHADDQYGMHSPLALNGTNQCVCIALEDVDAAAARAMAAGARMIHPPHDTAYGAREFSCADPEGHVWSVGNYWGEP
ncbi:MAG: VOC family protein [Alphaproteobacteria bacterium]|nr:VOC family protein [Alphaproteobacteria bacterium]